MVFAVAARIADVDADDPRNLLGMPRVELVAEEAAPVMQQEDDLLPRRRALDHLAEERDQLVERVRNARPIGDRSREA